MSRSTPIAFRMIDAFFRHIWLFLIAMIVVSSVTMTAVYMRSRTFHATALTQVVTDDIASQLGVASQSNGWTSPAQQNVDHFNDLLNDDLPGGFLDTVLKAANLDQPIDLNPAAQDPRLAKLRKNLYVTPVSQTTYAVGLTWDRQDEAQRIVSAFRDQYKEEVGLEHQANSIATSKFLDSQIASYETQMRKSEQALIDYRSKNAGQLPEAQAANISQLSSLIAQLDNMKLTEHDGEIKRTQLLQRLKDVQPMSIMEQTSSESPMQTYIKKLKAQRDMMLAGNMLPTHPEVVAITEQIQALEKQYKDKAKSGASEATGALETKKEQNPEYQALQDQLLDVTMFQQAQDVQIKRLQEEIAHYEALAKTIPAAERELTDKTRNYSLLSAQYQLLLKQREQAQLKGSLDKVTASSSLSPIGAVYAEPTASSTKRLIMLVGSILLGLIVGIIAIVLSEWSDRSLRYARDTERLLGVPVLGTVPDAKTLWMPQNLLTGGETQRLSSAIAAPNSIVSSEG